jgi:hypothetical protein
MLLTPIFNSFWPYKGLRGSFIRTNMVNGILFKNLLMILHFIWRREILAFSSQLNFWLFKINYFLILLYFQYLFNILLIFFVIKFIDN